MNRIVRAVVGLVAGYVTGALAGAMAVALFSTNTHDKSVEMSMTGAFVTGPIGAVLGLLAAILIVRKSPDGRRL